MAAMQRRKQGNKCHRKHLLSGSPSFYGTPTWTTLEVIRFLCTKVRNWTRSTCLERRVESWLRKGTHVDSRSNQWDEEKALKALMILCRLWHDCCSVLCIWAFLRHAQFVTCSLHREEHPASLCQWLVLCVSLEAAVFSPYFLEGFLCWGQGEHWDRLPFWVRNLLAELLISREQQTPGCGGTCL